MIKIPLIWGLQTKIQQMDYLQEGDEDPAQKSKRRNATVLF